jgi:hypothetical protein
MEERRRL